MECDLTCGKGNNSAIDLYQYKIHVYFLINKKYGDIYVIGFAIIKKIIIKFAV